MILAKKNLENIKDSNKGLSEYLFPKVISQQFLKKQ